MSARFPPLRKALIALRIWRSFFAVRVALGRRPLPEVVGRLGKHRWPRRSGLSPRRLGVVVQKALTVAGRQPRCLMSSLVLYDLLGGEGEHPALVIGLPDSPATKDAHAWVEIDGMDVGPPPGRGTHSELARYGP